MKQRVLFYSILALITFVVSSFLGGTVIPTSTPSCAAGATSLTELNTACVLGSLEDWIVKLALFCILSGLIAIPLVLISANLANVSALKEQMFTPDNNDTPAMLLLGFMLWLGVVIFKVPYTLLANFLVNLAWRGSLSLLILVAINWLVFWLFRFSFSRYQSEVSAPGSNAVAWLTFIGLVLSVLII